MSFAIIRSQVILGSGGVPCREGLNPTRERSLKRSLKALVDRGDVVIVSGKGGQLDPYYYTTAEAFAAVDRETIINTANAERKWQKYTEAVVAMGELK